ncbi:MULTISPECIES: hypothetical protein [unclassified Streptomyces]
MRRPSTVAVASPSTVRLGLSEVASLDRRRPLRPVLDVAGTSVDGTSP